MNQNRNLNSVLKRKTRKSNGICKHEVNKRKQKIACIQLDKSDSPLYLKKQVNNMDETLLYLRESLSNHMGNDMCKEIYNKLASGDYQGEGAFVHRLDSEEIAYLNDILRQEMNYAIHVQDDVRLRELNEVYELLF